MWGVLFSCCDCTITAIRRKEDPWNAIISGSVTGGVLAMRAGLKAAGKSALVGGMILAAIEGLTLVMSRIVFPYFERQSMQGAGQVVVDELLPPRDPNRAKRLATPPSLDSSSPFAFN